MRKFWYLLLNVVAVISGLVATVVAFLYCVPNYYAAASGLGPLLIVALLVCAAAATLSSSLA